MEDQKLKEALRNRRPREFTTKDERKLLVKIDPKRCIGAMSCVYIAPTIFDCKVDLYAVRFKDVMDRTAESDTVIRAARACPTRAITVRDVKRGEDVVPPPQ